MPSWQGKSKGNRLGYSIFVSVLRHLGVFPAYFLLRFVAFYYFVTSFRSSRIILDYYRRLGIGKPGAYRRLYRNYYMLGQAIIDRIVLLSGIPNRFHINFDDEVHFHNMLAQNKGGLLLSAHLGNWEIAGHLLQRLKAPVYIVMFDGEHESLKTYLKSIKAESKANIIVLKEDLSHIYEISDALKRNGLVCMHADRFLDGNRILRTKLLGSDANFPAGPFAMAATLKVPVSFVFAMKVSALQYHFHATPIRWAGSGEKGKEMQFMLEEFAGEMEKRIRQYPEQWYNYYDFWKA
jgi:predicted LPLAT superfamily acyltransferase